MSIFINKIILNSLSTRWTRKVSKKIINNFLNTKPKSVNKIFYRGSKINQIYDDYNNAFLNERTIEIPLCLHLINTFAKTFHKPKILEVGNTLAHYEKNRIERLTIDKYEKYPGVINIDIVDLKDKATYDIVFSISTLEHVGFDYKEILENIKFNQAVEKCISLLRSKGLFIVTLPIFYRAEVDKFIFEDKRYFKKIFLRRKDFQNNWELSKEKDILKNKDILKYNKKFPCANALFIGIIRQG
jgi:SAM-dependent methyltransferase